MSEYIIVGDTDTRTGCLILAGFHSRERAENTIPDILKRPAEYFRTEHKNIRVEEIASADAWWRHGRLD